MDADDVVLYDVDAGVATLTLNRPDRLNAWTHDLEVRYFDLLDQADDDPDVRVIVVTGAGRGFCAGADSEVLKQATGGIRSALATGRPMGHALTVRKLTIAAINGGCAGVGFFQALCCDVRFAATDAKLTSAFLRRGIPPEFGAGWLLSRIVGAGHAADLLLSARTISGADARAIGLVTRAVERNELLATVYDYARDVAVNCSPRALAYGKAELRAAAERSYEEAAAFSLELYDRPGHDEDFGEGVRSFVERRTPAFANLEPRRSTPPGAVI